MAKQALIIIAKEGFQDKELEGTEAGLKSAGFEITFASTEAGICTGKYGDRKEANIGLFDVDVEAFDRVAFIGGPGAHALADNKEAQRIAKEAISLEKVLGAICIAPTILAKAGVLKGKKATVSNKDGKPGELLEAHGAMYTGDPVTVDGLIVTANGPEAAVEFGKRLAAL